MRYTLKIATAVAAMACAAAAPAASLSLRLREAAERAARQYEATGNPAEAKKWRAEVGKYREPAPPPRPAR